MNKETMTWIDIISKMYKDLHNSKRVIHSSSLSNNKRDRLIKYFERLENIHNKVSNSKRKSDELLLKSFYYDLYVIKPENIPESYFLTQVRIARERGYGNIEITPEFKQDKIKEIIKEQMNSLDKWIEYFLYDEESKSYEMWEKYWVFQGLQSLGKYNKETSKFSKRDKTTIYPFPPVEREYIFTTLKLMEEYIKDKKSDDEIKSALGSGNFKKLYEYVIKQSSLKGEHQSYSTDGIWIKYDQGGDYNKLRDSLQGYYTGWCTAAGENFAKKQLDKGDFYVYYSLDKNGEAKVPRIALRMDGHNRIGEIRGIAKNQNMESEMIPILNEKIKTFLDKDKYYKKEKDMNMLTIIDKKINNNLELTIEELIFLYEIDSEIEGFGFEKDPRIEEIKNKREKIKDLNKIFSKIKSIKANLDLSDFKTAEGLIMPQHIEGSLDLSSLSNVKNLILPQNITGILDLSNLSNAQNLVFPRELGSFLFLRTLTDATNVTFPKEMSGNLDLSRLTNAKNIILPQSIRGNLNLSSITNMKNIALPQEIGGSLNLCSLTTAEELILPRSIGGSLFLNTLTNVDNLILPENIGDSLYLNNLTSVERLMLPKKIGNYLFLSSITSAKGLIFPKDINYEINLRSLTSAKYLVLPETIKGGLDLSSITSAKNLVLPKKIEGTLYLDNLISAKYLKLPQYIGGYLNLQNLTNIDELKLPYNFNLDKLICSANVGKEIMNNPDKYYMEPPKDIKENKTKSR